MKKLNIIMQLSFSDYYLQKIHAGVIQADSEQYSIVQQMQLVYDLIEQYYTERSDFSFKDLNPFSSTKNKLDVQGIYLWGGVGRGKTYLLDMLFECLQQQQKLRLHFHRFMQLVHEFIKEQGEIEHPIKHVASHFAKKYKIICLDEIFVIDIGDAMILSELFKHLIAQGVTLLFTSNSPPTDLYKNGLQRARFLPAIELLLSSNKVIELKGEDDYRLHALEKVPVYQLSSDPDTMVSLESLFKAMAGVRLQEHRNDIIINFRCIPVVKWESGIIWFSFDMICDTNRDSSDYINIATFFHTVIVSDIYCLDADKDDAARRFINLVDVFYDRHINLVISAQTLPEKLYTGSRLQFEFSRTQSRLNEMQTHTYLSKNKLFKEMLDSVDTDIKSSKAFSEINNPTRFGDWVNNGRCSDF
ncbi:MAG: cell division protein ZapE [Pseudomonadota bacterium]